MVADSSSMPLSFFETKMIVFFAAKDACFSANSAKCPNADAVLGYVTLRVAVGNLNLVSHSFMCLKLRLYSTNTMPYLLS